MNNQDFLMQKLAELKGQLATMKKANLNESGELEITFNAENVRKTVDLIDEIQSMESNQ